MDWERLNREKSAEIIGKVTHASDAQLFSNASSEAVCTALPFYKSFLLYRITNYATLPSFSMDFLGDGHTFYLLDGSPDPIFMVNSRGNLQLKFENVLDYIEFFLKYVTTDDGDIYLIQDPDNLPFLDSMSVEQQINLKQRFTPPALDYNHEEDAFELHGDLYYGGTLLKAKISVYPDGTLTFSDQSMFYQDAPAAAHAAYTDPDDRV